MRQHVIAAVVSALSGAFVGWCASGAVVVSRVEAIEKTLARIELRLDAGKADAKVAGK